MQWERWPFSLHGGPAASVTVRLVGESRRLMGQKTRPLKKREPGRIDLVLFSPSVLGAKLSL